MPFIFTNINDGYSYTTPHTAASTMKIGNLLEPDDPKKDYTLGDTVYHECYGKGVIVQIGDDKEGVYFVEFKNYIKHFRTNKYWCTKIRLSENPFFVYNVATRNTSAFHSTMWVTRG